MFYRALYGCSGVVTEISRMMFVVKNRKPLILHMTNYVTANDCANITLCAGGLPIMMSVPEDAIDTMKKTSALILNIGTPDSFLVDSMIRVGKFANNLNVPVILDPVGIRVGSYREKLVKQILSEVKVSVIKGNCREIWAMSNMNGKVMDFNAVNGLSDNVVAVKNLADTTGSIVAMTGKVDYVSNGTHVHILSNGNPVMDRVTGTGCMVSSVIGCYVGTLGVSADVVSAALSVFSISGEIAAMNSNGPGTFKSALMDSLSNLKDSDIEIHLRASRYEV